MTHTSIFRTWQDRLNTGELTKGQINQFVSGIYAKACGDIGGKTSNLTQEEAEILVTRVEQNPVRVTEQQAQQGRVWLARYWKRLGLPELDYASITHFTFDGAEEHSNGYRSSFSPIYTAYFPNGQQLTYHPTPWQAGRGSYTPWTLR